MRYTYTILFWTPIRKINVINIAFILAISPETVVDIFSLVATQYWVNIVCIIYFSFNIGYILNNTSMKYWNVYVYNWCNIGEKYFVICSLIFQI